MATKKAPSLRPPPRRETIEVDTSWLEPPDEDAQKRARRPSTEVRRPSKTMGAVVPPKPAGPAGVPRRETMEVQADWLELDEAPPAAGARGTRRSVADARAVRPSRANLPKAAPPPLPAAPLSEKTLRQPWEPPPLPPPPANAARARRALPPPLPRGEDEPDQPAKPAPARKDSRRPPRR